MKGFKTFFARQMIPTFPWQDVSEVPNYSPHVHINSTLSPLLVHSCNPVLRTFHKSAPDSTQVSINLQYTIMITFLTSMKWHLRRTLTNILYHFDYSASIKSKQIELLIMLIAKQCQMVQNVVSLIKVFIILVALLHVSVQS